MFYDHKATNKLFPSDLETARHTGYSMG